MFKSQLGQLPDPGFLDDAPEEKDWYRRLCAWQAGADSLAQRFQRKLFTYGVPRMHLDEVMERRKDYAATYRRLPPVGALLIFALTVPFAILMFEFFVYHLLEFQVSHIIKFDFALGAYVLTYLGASAYFFWIIHPQRWQHRFQDYRALSEALRVQLFCALSGVRFSVTELYSWKHRADLGWIGFAIRGVSIWSTALAIRGTCPYVEIVKNGWISSQRDYFRGASVRNRAMGNFCRRGLLAFLFIGGLSAACLLLVHVIMQLPTSQACKGALETLKIILAIIAATAPAIAAAFGILNDGWAFDGHSRNYRTMRKMFELGLRAASDMRNDAQEFQALILALSQEALNENAEWLMDHRHRPIDFKPG